MRGSKTMGYECDDSLTPALPGGRGGVRAFFNSLLASGVSLVDVDPQVGYYAQRIIS